MLRYAYPQPLLHGFGFSRFWDFGKLPLLFACQYSLIKSTHPHPSPLSKTMLHVRALYNINLIQNYSQFNYNWYRFRFNEFAICLKCCNLVLLSFQYLIIAYVMKTFSVKKHVHNVQEKKFQ